MGDWEDARLPIILTKKRLAVIERVVHRQSVLHSRIDIRPIAPAWRPLSWGVTIVSHFTRLGTCRRSILYAENGWVWSTSEGCISPYFGACRSANQSGVVDLCVVTAFTHIDSSLGGPLHLVSPYTTCRWKQSCGWDMHVRRLLPYADVMNNMLSFNSSSQPCVTHQIAF